MHKIPHAEERAPRISRGKLHARLEAWATTAEPLPLQPLDVGTAGGELLLQPLVATVEGIDSIDRGVALRVDSPEGNPHPRRRHGPVRGRRRPGERGLAPAVATGARGPRTGGGPPAVSATAMA